MGVPARDIKSMASAAFDQLRTLIKARARLYGDTIAWAQKASLLSQSDSLSRAAINVGRDADQCRYTIHLDYSDQTRTPLALS